MTEPRRQALDEEVRRIRGRILRYRQRRASLGEDDTKRTLITPLLEALGWDILDVEEVRNEYRHRPQDNPVDYALFVRGTPSLFVEAKALKASLDDRRWVSQTINYANTAAIEWCVLTNGDDYRLYNVHARVEADEKLFRAVRLSDETDRDFTLQTLELLSKDYIEEKRLNVLWKAHFVDRRVTTVLESLFVNQDAGFIRLLRRRAADLTPGDIKSSLKRIDMRLDLPHRDLGAPAPARLEGRESAKPAEEKGDTVRVEGRRKHAIPHWLTLAHLIEAGLMTPPFRLEVVFKGQHLTAVVQADGTVVFDGKTYTSLSVSAGMARNSVSGPPQDGRAYYQTNGWTFWKYRDAATGKLEPIDVLRQHYLRKRGIGATR